MLVGEVLFFWKAKVLERVSARPHTGFKARAAPRADKTNVADMLGRMRQAKRNTLTVLPSDPPDTDAEQFPSKGVSGPNLYRYLSALPAR